MNKDLEHLKILSISYYIYAGVTALFFCFPFIHLFLGIALVTGKFPNDGTSTPPPSFVGWMFIGIASIFIVGGWAIAIATFFAGKNLKKRKNWIFCVVMAGLNCMFFPIGTTLGIFTFIVLFRESVKSLFNPAASNNISSFGNNPPDWR